MKKGRTEAERANDKCTDGGEEKHFEQKHGRVVPDNQADTHGKRPTNRANRPRADGAQAPPASGPD
jgi:hypothetical protein